MRVRPRASYTHSPRRGEFAQFCRGQAKLLGSDGKLDGLNHLRRIRRGARLEALQNLAVAANDELGEIPLDVAGEWGVCARQGNIQRVALLAVHVNFIEERES